MNIPQQPLKQVPPSSPVLNLKARAVPIGAIQSTEVQHLIDELFAFAYGNQGDAKLPTLVGLAAPQLGVSKRIIIIGLNATGAGEQPQLQELINPVISNASAATEQGREGCYSTGRVCGIVERAQQVKLSGYDRNGIKRSYTLTGFPARVAQHEVDHLGGIRFPDRIGDDAHLHWVEEADFGRYRQEWSTWTLTCPRQRWESIKSGNEL